MPNKVPLLFSKGSKRWWPSPRKVSGSTSALVQAGRCLWVASDQTATVERLTADNIGHPTAYTRHRSFRIGDFVSMPQDSKTEVDLEGMDLQWLSPDTGYLWLVGSHSRTRRQDKNENGSPAKFVRALRSIDLDSNRRALIRIPISVDSDGVSRLKRALPDPRDTTKRITAGLLPDLGHAIVKDRHLQPFQALPGKDNGIDIEGLAAVTDRIYVGMRGPVLRGWAVVLQLQVKPGADLARGERLQLRRRSDGRPFRKHFLDLAGLGVRELYADGEDMVLLAGPTMMLDGPVRLIRWPGGATEAAGELVRADKLHLIKELPYGQAHDHAEGFTRIRTPSGSSLLVTYDSPTKNRLVKQGRGVYADLFPWPGDQRLDVAR